MKLDKYLNNSYIASSSEAKKIIRNGLVEVNDIIIKNPNYLIDINNDIVTVNSKKVEYKENYYFILNKPKGYVTSTNDPQNKTIMELFSDLPIFLQKNLFPVGRLDLDTEGLLIITTDGEFSHIVTSPKSNIKKTYYIEFEGCLPLDAEEILSQELQINGETFAPSKLQIINDNSCYLTIKEGKYHQVKKITHYLGVCLTYLKRVKIGDLVLDDDIMLGEYKEISEKEIKKLIKKV